MKYMLILNARADSEMAAAPRDHELTTRMGIYNDELIKAGVLLAGEGLHASSTGARIEYDGERRTIIDGPFAETEELIAGFWIVQVASRHEALEWARRIPLTSGRVEVRRVLEIDDFEQAKGDAKAARGEAGGEPLTA